MAVSHAGGLTQAGALAGQVLVQVVRAITSLKIAGSQLAAAGVNTVFGGLVDKIRYGLVTLLTATWNDDLSFLNVCIYQI